MISLASKFLVGPFKNPPDPTEPFKEKLKPDDIRKLILNLKSKNYQKTFVEVSKNLMEYSVCQLQNFGAKIFYGFSTEPIPIWSFSENAILKSRDVKERTISLPDVSFFKSQKLEDENQKIMRKLKSTRISPKREGFSPAKTITQM